MARVAGEQDTVAGRCEPTQHASGREDLVDLARTSDPVELPTFAASEELASAETETVRVVQAPGGRLQLG
jgi:hypothetical protein